MTLENKDIDRLYRKYRNMVRGVLFEYVKDASVVSDLMNDVYVRVLESKHTYKGEAKASTWLHRITQRTALNYLRDKERKPELVFETDMSSELPDDMEEESWLEQNTIDADDPEQMLMLEEYLAEHLPKLTDVEQQVAEYFYDYAMSAEEIAEEMDMATGTVYVHMKNIKDKLSS